MLLGCQFANLLQECHGQKFATMYDSGYSGEAAQLCSRLLLCGDSKKPGDEEYLD